MDDVSGIKALLSALIVKDGESVDVGKALSAGLDLIKQHFDADKVMEILSSIVIKTDEIPGLQTLISALLGGASGDGESLDVGSVVQAGLDMVGHFFSSSDLVAMLQKVGLGVDDVSGIEALLGAPS